MNQVFLKPNFVNDSYVLEDKLGNLYNCLRDDKDSFLKYCIKNGNSIKVTETNGVLQYRAGQLGQFIADGNVAPEFHVLIETQLNYKTLDVITDERREMINFLNASVGLKPGRLKMSELKWKYLVRSVKRGKNIMMTGATGSGKTFAVQCLGVAFPERKLFKFNLGATQDPRASLIGNTHFAKESGTYFSESYFVKAIQTPGAIVMLDELSRAHPEAMNILMTVLDEGQRYLRLDEADGSPEIPVAAGVSFIATANIGNEYTATRVIDRAMLDRFTIIEMELLTAEDEVELLRDIYTDLSIKKINAIAEIAHATRLEVKNDNSKISTMISTRATVELAGLMNDGFTLIEAADVAIYPFYPEEGGVDSERVFMKQLIQKYADVDTDNTDLFNVDVEEITADTLSNKKPF